MRKITPTPLFILRDPFAILRDNKIIANHNLYSASGDLLSPNGYGVPPFRANTSFDSGTENLPSYPASAISNGGIVADGGRSATAAKVVIGSAGTLSLYTSYMSEGQGQWCVHGIDSFLPGVFRTAKGPDAGRYIARHPSGYLDVTSDTMSTPLEVNHATGNVSAAASSASGNAQYYSGTRILDESELDVLVLATQAGQHMSTTSTTFYPIRPIKKNFTSSGIANSAASFQLPPMPIYIDKDERFLLLVAPTQAMPNNGVYGYGPQFTSIKWSETDMNYSGKKHGALPVMDSFVDSTTTLFSLTSPGAGFKTIPILRAFARANNILSTFVPYLLAPKSVTNNIVTSASMRIVDYDIAQDTTSVVSVTFYNTDGSVFTAAEEMHPLPGGVWSNIQKLAYSLNVAFYDVITSHVVGNETYINILRVPTGSTRRPQSGGTPIFCPMNTVQYTVRLDKQDRTRAYVECVEVLPGFMGVANEAMYSFAQTKDLNSMYVIGHDSVFRVNWDSTQLKYVLDDTHIEVNAISLVVTDDDDLHMIDAFHRYYALRREDSNIVRIEWDPSVVTEFSEAPYDAGVIVNTVNHMGERQSKAVELFVEGPAVFKSNNRNKITVTTNTTTDLAVQLTIKGYGQVYVTPLSVT